MVRRFHGFAFLDWLRWLENALPMSSRQNFEALSAYDSDCVIEFLKTPQVLPSEARNLDSGEDHGR
jgi:hypothetical protein